jgi:O-antigen/teichoic acid export membrane protein
MIDAEKQHPVRRFLGTLISRSRTKNSIYLALSLIARVLNAAGMFIALQRFAPSTFGEMSYLQATAVSTVAFCSLGIELSVNAQLTRKIKEGSRLAPTILAACALAILGIVLACIAVSLAFASQLTVTGSTRLAVVAVCIYSSFMILTSLLTAMSFALSASINVGVSYILTSSLFAAFAIFANTRTSGIGLMFFSVVAQVIAVSYMAIALAQLAKSWKLRGGYARLQTSLPATKSEVKTLFMYGAKQILVVSTITFSQWLIQRKIVYGDGGASENAIYSIGNQIFNMMTFIPLIITPIVITRLAAAGDDLAQRKQISLASLKLFSGIAAIACVAVFVGLRIGIPFLPPRYAAAETTGIIASFAAAFQIVKSPFSLFFLAELKASREIASATAGALFMIAATATYVQLTPNQGTTIRLLGCALQGVVLAAMFFIETRRRETEKTQGPKPTGP